jgi:hypothetical protein
MWRSRCTNGETFPFPRSWDDALQVMALAYRERGGRDRLKDGGTCPGYALPAIWAETSCTTLASPFFRYGL